MTREVVTISPDTEITRAAKILLEKGFNGMPVLDDQGRLVGILCRSDLIVQQKNFPLPSVFTLLDAFIPLRSLKQVDKEVQKIAATRTADAMSPRPVTVNPDTKIEQIASLMVDRKYHTLPVVDKNGKLVGIIGKEDILKTLLSE
jgi:CBS domain-containing protein